MAGEPQAGRVRRMRGEADARAAAELLDRFNRDYDEPTPGVEFLTRRLLDLDGDTVPLIARDGGLDAGIAVVRFRPALWADADEAYLAELFVLPGHRRAGLGGELMESVLALARERGCAWIDLGTDEGDTDAHRLYRRFGFSGFSDPGAPEGERERMFFFEREL